MKQFGQIKTEKGSIMPVTAVAMVAIMGMTGLVFDSSHLYVNKTKLQNVLDASVLGAAKILDDTRNQMTARQAAKRIFSSNINQSSYKELKDLGLDETDLVIQFSDTRNPFIANPAASKFVRIRVNQGVVNINTIFLNMFGVDSLTLSGSAVAGPSPALGTVCNVIPTIVCGDPDMPPDNNGMFGYNYGEQVTLAMGNTTNTAVGPGNFQLIDLGFSGNDSSLRESLAGNSDSCISSGGSVETKPGANRGPVSQGFNTRFGIYTGPVSAEDYPPDLVVDAGADNYPDTYTEYKSDYATHNYDEPVDGMSERRVMTITFGKCDATINGQGIVETIGFGCVFLNKPAQNNGALQTVQMSAELVRDCRSSGVPGPNPVDGPGVHTIQLYGDPDRWDS